MADRPADAQPNVESPPAPSQRLEAPEPLVRIRGRGDGIALQIAPGGDWSQAVERLGQRLAQADHFFRGGKVALEVGSRRLSEEELELLNQLLARHEITLVRLRASNKGTFQLAKERGLEVQWQTLTRAELEAVEDELPPAVQPETAAAEAAETQPEPEAAEAQAAQPGPSAEGTAPVAETLTEALPEAPPETLTDPAEPVPALSSEPGGHPQDQPEASSEEPPETLSEAPLAEAPLSEALLPEESSGASAEELPKTLPEDLPEEPLPQAERGPDEAPREASPAPALRLEDLMPFPAASILEAEASAGSGEAEPEEAEPGERGVEETGPGERALAEDASPVDAQAGDEPEAEPGMAPEPGPESKPEPEPAPEPEPEPLAGPYLYRGTLRSGQVLRHAGPVLVVGDVNPGAEVVAGGDVFVWGRLRGIVHAGAAGDAQAVIGALDFEPVQVRIADHIAMSPKGNTDEPGHWLWKRSSSGKPEVARLVAGQIVVDPWDMRPSKGWGTTVPANDPWE